MRSWALRSLLLAVGGAILLCGCGGNSETDFRKLSRKRVKEPDEEVAAVPKPAPAAVPAEGTPAQPTANPATTTPPAAPATATPASPVPPPVDAVTDATELPALPRPYIPPDDEPQAAPKRPYIPPEEEAAPIPRPFIPSDDEPRQPAAAVRAPVQPAAVEKKTTPPAEPAEVETTDATANLVVLLASLLDEQPDQRRSVPDAEDQKVVGETLKNLYKDEYDAARKANKASEFIHKMLAETSRFIDDPSANYVINDIVRKMSIGIGDLDSAVAAIRNIDRDYRVDGLQLRYDTLSQVSDLVKGNGPANQSVAQHAEALVNAAIAQGKFDIGIKANELVKACARRSLDKAAQDFVKSRELELEAWRNLHAEMIEAAKLLRDHPEDPVARQTVGVYVALMRNDFSAGLPLVSQGEDVRWKMIAKIDLEESKTPANVAALGDLWWSLADTLKNPLRRAAHLRAVHWYKQAIPLLGNNLQKATAEGKLKEAEKLYPQVAAANRATAAAEE